METPFFAAVYAAVRSIPSGRVATYGQIALLVGSPRASRAGGTALALCRDPEVPCHRVVDRFGGTKPAFDTYGTGVQRRLLEAEGVGFLPDGRADLARFQWEPTRAE